MANDIVDSEGRYWRLDKWFPDLSSDARSRLRAYHSELIYFNGRMSLISPRTEKNADLVHLADAIVGSREIFKSCKFKEIYDVGSGNGIPGIVMAIIAPEIKFVLVEADARKVEFLKHCIARSNLTNCEALHLRLEDLPERSMHCAVTRGVASLSKTLLMSRKAAAEDCHFFHFKGRSWVTELSDVPPQILSSWEPIHLTDYSLPAGEATLSIVLTRRVQS